MAELNDAMRDTESDSGSAILLTPEGYKALHEELEHLTLVKRPEIADRIRESQEHGEFSEDNSELDEVKFEQAMVESRIAELKTIFGSAQILTSAAIPTDIAGVGSRVKLKDLDMAEEFEVRLVSGVEADPSKDHVSVDSPMGVALLGRKAGETVEVSAPDGLKKYKLVSIRK